MKIAISGVCAASLLALSGAALAQGTETENPRGWYVGGAVGQFNVEVDGLDGVDEALDGLDADDTAWKIFTGYRLTPNISLEAAYVNFGEPGDDFSSAGSNGNYSLSISGFQPSVVGTIPMGPVELYGRLGYYFYDVDLRTDFDGDLLSSDDSGEDMVWGVGVGLTFMERINARFEYENVDIDGTDDANAFWLSAAYRF